MHIQHTNVYDQISGHSVHLLTYVYVVTHTNLAILKYIFQQHPYIF